MTLHNPSSVPARAYADAARRLMGETIDIIVPVERKGLMSRFFGRSVA